MSTTTPDASATPVGSDVPSRVPGLILDDGPEYMPALTLGGALPKERNGLALFHYYKESLRPGTFTDARGKAWTVTPADIDAAKADAERALAMGHEPTIQDDHFKPQRSFGFVTGVRKNDRGGLDLLHSFMGERNRDDALTRKTSVCLLPNYTDARGNKFKWFPDHSAVVFRPQLKDLKDYEPALAASGEQVEAVRLSLAGDKPQPAAPPPQEPPMDPINWKPHRDAMGDDAKGVKDEDMPEATHKWMAKMAKKAKAMAMAAAPLRTYWRPENTAGKDDEDVLAMAAADVPNLHAALADAAANADRLSAANAALALSAEPPEDAPTRRELAMAARAAEGEIKAAEAQGHVTPAQAALLRKMTTADATLALSADVGQPSKIDDFIAFAVAGADRKPAGPDNGHPSPDNRLPRDVAPVKPRPATLALAGAANEGGGGTLDLDDPETAKLLDMYNLTPPAR